MSNKEFDNVIKKLNSFNWDIVGINPPQIKELNKKELMYVSKNLALRINVKWNKEFFLTFEIWLRN